MIFFLNIPVYLYLFFSHYVMFAGVIFFFLLFILQVDLSNLEEYISLVVDATIKTGILRQIEAFRSGFNQVCVGYRHLQRTCYENVEWICN